MISIMIPIMISIPGWGIAGILELLEFMFLSFGICGKSIFETLNCCKYGIGKSRFSRLLMVNGSWLMAHGSRLMVHASRLVAQGSWLMAKKNVPLGPTGPGPSANLSWP